MGHANRSRRHHALGLDAQSRRVRFPSGRRWESNPDAYGYADGNSYSYGHSNTNSDGHGNPDSNSNSDADVNA
jgi:hypothetical protein